VQGGHEEISGTVTGEDSARAVCAMRSRRKPDQQQSRVRIAEARHWQSPIRIQTVGALFLRCDAATVVAQSRTTVARDDRAMDLNET
jgi:hypothetical protein